MYRTPTECNHGSWLMQRERSHVLQQTINMSTVTESALPFGFGARLGRSLALGARLWRSLGSCPLPLGCRLQLRCILIGAVHNIRLRHRSFPCSMPLGGRGGRGRSSGSTALACCPGWGGSARSGSALCFALVTIALTGVVVLRLLLQPHACTMRDSRNSSASAFAAAAAAVAAAVATAAAWHRQWEAAMAEAGVAERVMWVAQRALCPTAATDDSGARGTKDSYRLRGRAARRLWRRARAEWRVACPQAPRRH